MGGHTQSRVKAEALLNLSFSEAPDWRSSRVSFLIKMHAVGNFIITRLRHKCFPVNFLVVLKTPALKHVCEQLLLVFY